MKQLNEVVDNRRPNPLKKGEADCEFHCTLPAYWINQ
jgi:hypothetical protein